MTSGGLSEASTMMVMDEDPEPEITPEADGLEVEALPEEDPITDVE